MTKNYMKLYKTAISFLKQKSPVQSISQRSISMDIAKGLLIILLLYNHTAVFSFVAGIHDPVANFIEDSKCVFTVFFMQSFFLITGYCTNFNRSVGSFLWRNIKTLIIPALLLGKLGVIITGVILESPIQLSFITTFVNWFNGHGPWFIVTLFFCKLIYWILNKYNYGIQMAVIAALYLVGIYCNIRYWAAPEYLCYLHILLMLPFLFIGNLAKQYNEKVKRYLPLMAKIGSVVIILESIAKWTMGIPVPILDASIAVPYYYVPLHFLNAITGSALLIVISRSLVQYKWLSEIGKYTLLIYLWNGVIHPIVIHFLTPFYDNNSILSLIVFHSISLSLCVIVSYWTSKVIYETKYLNVIVGKW